jgi:transposase
VPIPVSESAERHQGERFLEVSDLVVPANISLIPLPPYAPELNPVERIWLHLRERLLSHCLLDVLDAVLEARCEAWNALTPECIRSLTTFP